jgi:hypothetical protein
MNVLKRDKARLPLARGFTVVEVAVCVVLLAALITTLGKTIAAVDVDMRRVDDRAHAMRTLENLLERFLAAPWDAIRDDRIRSLTLRQEIAERWPRAAIEGSVVEMTEPVHGKRITLSLSLGRDQRERPVTLTTWVFKAPRE